MCSRYLIGDGTFEALKEGFCEILDEEGEDFFLPFLNLRGDIRPSMAAPVLLRETVWRKGAESMADGGRPDSGGAGCDNSRLRMKKYIWGFPGVEGKGLIINARCETALVKRLFAESVQKRRCLIPAVGFYEWSERKDPYFFAPKGQDGGKGRLLLMAGFYRKWEGQERFVILTTQANASVQGVHPRMPLILSMEEAREWLREDCEVSRLLAKTPEELAREPLGQLSLFS